MWDSSVTTQLSQSGDNKFDLRQLTHADIPLRVPHSEGAIAVHRPSFPVALKFAEGKILLAPARVVLEVTSQHPDGPGVVTP